jgi:hypothetical protein
MGLSSLRVSRLRIASPPDEIRVATPQIWRLATSNSAGSPDFEWY